MCIYYVHILKYCIHVCVLSTFSCKRMLVSVSLAGGRQSRLRLRIQSLEKENQELCSDLKMMEQTRLQLWHAETGKGVVGVHLMSTALFPKKNGH